MKIEITEQEQKILLDIINNSGFKGSAIEEICELKKKISEAKDDTGLQGDK